MFKNFNWKRYAIKVAIVWALFLFIMGFVSEFNAQAKQDENIWMELGSGLSDLEGVEVEYKLYALKGSLMATSSGNLVITVKLTYGNLGQIINDLELDYTNRKVRTVKVGNTLENRTKLESTFEPPIKGSISEYMLEVICPKFKLKE